MARPVLHLLDPHHHLRQGSKALRKTATKEYATFAELLNGLEGQASPLLAVADFTDSSTAPAETAFPGGSDPLVLLLVTTDDETAGKRWLRAGASDFVVLPSPLDELDVRIERLVRLHQQLVRCFERSPGEEFLRHFIHDFKNPLNAIFGYCQLLLLDPEIKSCAARDDVKNVLKNAELLLEGCNRLVNDAGDHVHMEYAGRTP